MDTLASFYEQAAEVEALEDPALEEEEAKGTLATTTILLITTDRLYE